MIKQKGFTLLELMIALSLGLLIVAAGLTIFISSQRSSSLQSNFGGLQQNANFGLSQLTYDLRHANLNTESSQFINSKIIGSGIIFDHANLPQKLNGVGASYFTNVTTEKGNADQFSDQITIQYHPSLSSIVDCEGNTIDNLEGKDVDGNVVRKRVIVQRYYLELSEKQISGDIRDYSLMCDAGFYDYKSNTDSDTTITGLDSNAQPIMQHIDAFKVRLGVKNPVDNSLRYMSLTDFKAAIDKTYKDFTTEETRLQNALHVISIEVGVLARSIGRISSDANMNTNITFKLAGTSTTLSGRDAINQQYLRQQVNQVVAIRNTLGASR